MHRTQLAVAAAASTLVLGTGVVAAQAETQESTMYDSIPLAGVWVVTVDPAPNPGGDPPPFESTLAYGAAHDVSEITSRTTGTSAGLGRWFQTGDDTYATRWQKYRFDSTGAYIGKTVVAEEITMTSRRTYTAHAVTTVQDTTGQVVAQFESEASGVRYPRKG